MNITIFRIDDRLIHGQVVTAWIAYSDAKQILVADDKAATDSLQQSLLKMATPKSVKLDIMSLEDAKLKIETDASDTKTLLLVRGPAQALTLIDACKEVNSINIGNLNMKKGKRKILDNCWVDEDEVSNLKKLGEKVEVEVRAIPKDRKQNLMNLL
ncbi:PTS system mannose/fructose/N-acetylgalactosamine-transporter subunit IIB [Amedibacillus sp. YH-ame10]